MSSTRARRGYKNGWAKVPEVDQAKQFAADRTPTLMDRLPSRLPS